MPEIICYYGYGQLPEVAALISFFANWITLWILLRKELEMMEMMKIETITITGLMVSLLGGGSLRFGNQEKQLKHDCNHI